MAAYNRTTKRTIGLPVELVHGPGPWRAVMPFGEKETDAWRNPLPVQEPVDETDKEKAAGLE